MSCTRNLSGAEVLCPGLFPVGEVPNFGRIALRDWSRPADPGLLPDDVGGRGICEELGQRRVLGLRS